MKSLEKYLFPNCILVFFGDKKSGVYVQVLLLMFTYAIVTHKTFPFYYYYYYLAKQNTPSNSQPANLSVPFRVVASHVVLIRRRARGKSWVLIASVLKFN